MALATDGVLGSLAISVHGAFDAAGAGLLELAAAAARVFAALQQTAAGFSNVLLKILSYFWGPIPWMIEVAIVLSGVVRHWPDFFIILILLVSNAAVGFLEERQTGNAIEALNARRAVKARVKRGDAAGAGTGA